MSRRLDLDTRMLAAAGLAAITALVVLAATRPEPTTGVLVAASPAAAGTPVATLNLGTRAVSDPTGMVRADDLESIADHVLVVDLDAGSPLVASIVASPATGAGVDVIGLELTSDAAVHGELQPGDAVDVYDASAPEEPIARGVAVVGVFADGGTLGIGDVGVLLAVDDALAPLVVAATADGTVHLVRRGR